MTTLELAPAENVDSQLRLSEVISAMSYALDITEGQPEGHAIRSCLIGMRIAEELRIRASDKAALFYALLLKDLGCSSNAAKMCFLFQADDRQVKRDVKLVDWTGMLPGLKFLSSHALPEANWWHRLGHVIGLVRNKEEAGRELVQVRCERGADISRLLGLPEATAQAILALDEHWNGAGHPLGLSKHKIPLLGRICCLAQTAEVFIANEGIRQAVSIINDRKGKWFDPELVNVFNQIAKERRFMESLTSKDIQRELSKIEPPDHIRLADAENLDRIATGFSQVIDAKSPWTQKHSQGVSNIAVTLGETLGFDAQKRRELRQAGLLHDIGKLGVSNLILDKPSKLTDIEYAQMKDHAMHSQRILSRVSAFAPFADYASAHHERLDGKGYHRGLAGEQIAVEARILAVADVCEALAADRPYRAGMPPDRILEILNAERGKTFCPSVVDTFEQRADAISMRSLKHQKARVQHPIWRFLPSKSRNSQWEGFK